MSPELKSVLRAAGWKPDRSISISNMIKTLRSYGFNIVPDAEAVLQEFGGLSIDPVRTPADKHALSTVVFDPLGCAELDRVIECQDQLGMNLTPIGKVFEQACLLIAEDGSVYTAWDRFLWKNGVSLLDALENTLIFGRQNAIEMLRQ